MEIIEKVAHVLYQKMFSLKFIKRWTAKKAIRDKYYVLMPHKCSEQVEKFYEKKISYMLLVFVATILVSVALFFSDEDTLSSGILSRNGYEEGEKTENVTVEIPQLQIKENMQITLDEPQYTKQQVRLYMEDVKKKLPQKMLGANTSLQEVTSALNLVSSIEGNPVSIVWDIEEELPINEEGELEESRISGESISGMVKAELSCQDETETLSFAITINPFMKTREEKALALLKEQIEQANIEQIEQKNVKLPQKVKEYDVVYKSSGTKAVFLIPIVGFLTIILVSWGMDRDLQKEVENRQKQIQSDYPEMVSTFSMLICAGMTIKGAFIKIASDYEKKGGKKRYIYEEMVYACRQMQYGTSEIKAYEQFGKRCKTVYCNKFSALLVQSVKKGHAGLGQTLKQQVDYVMSERKNGARKLGEEASTKLLLPMGLMLLVVLVIIMVPAMLSFSV